MVNSSKLNRDWDKTRSSREGVSTTRCSDDPKKNSSKLNRDWDKTRSSRKGVSTTRCFDDPKKNSSKLNRDWDERLICTGCRQEFPIPKNTTAFPCNICNSFSYSLSGSEKSRKDSKAKSSKHDQPNNANTNGALLSRYSLSAGSSSSFSKLCKKRAVICGVTYGKSKFKLEGTINDVSNMKSLLVGIFEFPADCIRILTEDKKDPNLIPTKKNILESLKWLVQDCQSEDSLVFYFSGHGLQQPEHLEGDEIDRLCPVDFLREGMITDNELNSTLIRPLKEGVTLHAIIDASHSGTTLDLTYVYKKEKGNWKWEDNKPSHSKEHTMKHTSGGLAICLSACEDSQMAVDSAAFEVKKMNGIMTYLFSKIIRDHSASEITYASLIEKIHEEIGRIRQSKLYNSFLSRIFNRKIDQDPLLSSSEKFDVGTRIFKL